MVSDWPPTANPPSPIPPLPHPPPFFFFTQSGAGMAGRCSAPAIHGVQTVPVAGLPLWPNVRLALNSTTTTTLYWGGLLFLATCNKCEQRLKWRTQRHRNLTQMLNRIEWSVTAFIRTVIFNRQTSQWGNFYVIRTAWCQLDFSCIYLWMPFYPRCLRFSVVVINWCFMIGVKAWWVYLAPRNIPSAIVLTLGNKVVLFYMYEEQLLIITRTLVSTSRLINNACMVSFG